MNIQPGAPGNFASLKTPIFTDTLCVLLIQRLQGFIEGLLLDEHGTVCRKMEAEIPENAQELTWDGLNELPYGIYNLRLSQGPNEMNVRVVKRV
jgi:hypothetical protein